MITAADGAVSSSIYNPECLVLILKRDKAFTECRCSHKSVQRQFREF